MNRKASLVCVSLLAIIVLLTASTTFAGAPRRDPAGGPAAALPYAPDRVLIQVKASSMQQSKVRLQPQMAAPGIAMGIPSLDAVSARVGAVRIARPFIDPANAVEASRLGVTTLVDGVKSAGRHAVDFDASSLSSGIYFYRLNAGGVVEQKKMVLLK